MLEMDRHSYMRRFFYLFVTDCCEIFKQISVRPLTLRVYNQVYPYLRIDCQQEKSDIEHRQQTIRLVEQFPAMCQTIITAVNPFG